MAHKQELEELRQRFLSLRLERALSGLRNPLHLMNSGAHPDDEHSALLAWLRFARGLSITTLSSTRGQGGQNRFGPERGALLGLIRSREMELAAAVLDADHLWLDRGGDDPLSDFGFSKSGVDTLRRWGGAEAVTHRMVEAYRRARPDILLPTFLDVPGQHGHHRAMTAAALAALPLAADPSYSCEGLAPWRVAKAYLPAWSGGGATYDDELPPPPATLLLRPEGPEPWTGARWALIGEASRLAHASQDMGYPEARPDPEWPLHLIGGGAESDICEGLPQSYGALPEAPQVLAELDAVLAEAVVLREAALVQKLLAAEALLQKAQAAASPRFSQAQGHRLVRLQERLERALFLALGLLPEKLTASRQLLAKGQEADLQFEPPLSPEVSLSLHVNSGLQVNENQTKVTGTGAGAALAPAYAALGGNGAAYAVLRHDIEGHQICAKLDFAKALLPLPEGISAWDHPLLVHKTGAAKEFPLALPAGYELQLPQGLSYRHKKLIAQENLAAGHHAIGLSLGGKPLSRLRQGQLLSGEKVALVEPLRLDLLSLDLALPRGNIAYLAGSEDLMPAFAAMGLEVDALTNLPSRETLALYDTLLIGVVGFARYPALGRKLEVLRDWVAAGGNLVTFYQRPDQGWPAEGLGLDLLVVGQPSLRWRVTEPEAEVDFLAPDHPLLQGPNRITAQDFAGWDKERGLYFAAQWGARYAPLFAMADQGEAPLLGALVSGRFGRGRHSHCALTLHHQIQALRPGAFRLLANLLDRVGAQEEAQIP